MKGRRTLPSSLLVGIAVLASAAFAQSSGESANTSTGLGIADHSMTSNETVGQQQATERESSGKQTPEKKPDGKAASGAAPKDSGKAPSGKKVPMGSGGGGVTGAVGK